MNVLLKCVTLLLVLLSIAGCKLAVMVAEGGMVTSDNSGVCQAGKVCIVDVPDTSFHDAFEAVPKAGWYFHSWNRGGSFFCGGSLVPVCVLSMREHRGEPVLEKVVASPETFYLMPIFKPVEEDRIVRENRSVQVDGRAWLQPRDFVGYSYEEVAQICPQGLCAGQLPGSQQDLTGYRWASREDVLLLFQSYRKVHRPVSADFDLTTTDVYIDYILYAMLSDEPHVDQVAPDYFETRIYVAAIIGDGIDATSESRDIAQFPHAPDTASSIVGPWFWTPLD